MHCGWVRGDCSFFCREGMSDLGVVLRSFGIEGTMDMHTLTRILGLH
jgi:hypothetical protein